MVLNNPYVDLINNYNELIFTSAAEGNNNGKDLFEKKQPLVIDLGCGAGNFCIKYAVLHPEKNIVGFEIRYKRLVFGARKARKRQLPNVRFVQSRVEFFADWVNPGSVSEITSHFPDPWPKKRHHKHRYLNPDTFEKIYTCLQPGGIFCFKTDYLQYFEEVESHLTNSDRFRIEERSNDYKTSDYFNPDVISEFEMLFYTKNVPVNYLKAVKLSLPQAD